MAFLLDNCVLNEKLPFCARAVDYSSELNLFAAVDDELFVWDPETKKTIAIFQTAWDGVGDVLFLPGNYIAVPGGEAHHGSCIEIFSLNEKDAVFEIEEHAGPLALTPDKNLLCGEEYSEIVEIRLDLKNMKVLEFKEVWSPDYGEQLGTEALCCSSNYTVCRSDHEDSWFSCFDVLFTADGKVSLTNEQTISYCMINGEKRSFGAVHGLAHDGEHIIVGTEKDIVVLESAREGSPAHVIVSSVKCDHLNYETYGIRLNNENQLMVCEKNFIKVYDYKRPNCLQGLCRNQIKKSLRQKGKKNTSVELLPIPQSLKDYLLYKV